MTIPPLVDILTPEARIGESFHIHPVTATKIPRYQCLCFSPG